MTLLLIGLILFSAFIGTPIFIVILAFAILGFSADGVDLSVITIEIYRLTELPLISTLPLFTFAGYLLSEAKTSERLVQLANAILGWMPAGLAIIALLVSAVFTALTGASGVTIVAIGALLYPALLKANYKEEFSLGLVTTSGSLGLLLPPSVPLILYGIVAQQMNVGPTFTINDLFLAGIGPVVLMVLALVFYAIWNRPATNRDVAQAISLKTAIRQAAWELPLPLFILFGVYGGIFTLSEVASVTVLYVILVEVFIYKEISIKHLPNVILNAMTVSGGILIILASSLALSNYMIDAEIPNQLFKLIQGHISSPIVFLALLNIFLLVLGAILDIFSALLIVVPLILPVAVGFGIHPIHLGIIFLANMQIGYFTPPIGMNLFIASYRFHKPLLTLYRAAIPFMLVLLFVLLIITYWPFLSLWML